MTPSQAARIIGCSVSQVRHLIRTGKIKAKIVRAPGLGGSYKVSPQEVRRYKALKLGGFPRGTKRLGPRGKKVT